VATTTQPITAEELLQMPDGDRYELVRGELRAMSPPSFRHGEIALNFGIPLRLYVKAKGLGRVAANDPGFILARKPDTVMAPDVAFLRTNRLPPGVDAEGYRDGAPDLAMEVVSRGDTPRDVAKKAQEWLEKGCPMVVLVNDRKRTVTVYRPGRSPRILQGEDVFDGEDVVPGFRLPLAEIFAS
jgi:Uma2 family endonuclease